MIEKIKIDRMRTVMEVVSFFFDDRHENRYILITKYGMTLNPKSAFLY